MAHRIKIESFEGPFELLLSLVTSQKVAIGSISISEVADQYMEHLDKMEELDMDVASEFLIIASTLLSLKAKALLPADEVSDDELDDEFANLTVEQTTNILAERIINYYKYKRVATMLGSRMQNESMMHPRTAGPDPEFLRILPDYLENVTLFGIAVICASLMAKRETFLLDAEHITAKPVAIEIYIKAFENRIRREKRATFGELLDNPKDLPSVVASFLAILEMYKRGMIDLVQEESDSQIQIDYIDPSEWDKFAMKTEEIPEEEDV